MGKAIFGLTKKNNIQLLNINEKVGFQIQKELYQISLSWEKKLRWQKFLAQAASIQWKLIKNGHLRNHTLKRSKEKTRRDHKFIIECWLFHLLISAICSFGLTHKVEIWLDGFKPRLLPDELLTLWEKIDSSLGKSRTSKIW